MRFHSRWTIALTLAIPILAISIPTSVRAYRRWRDFAARSKLENFVTSPLAGDEGWIELDPPEETPENDLLPRPDDARRRLIAARALWGEATPEASAERARIAHAESIRWAHLLPPAARSAGGMRPSLPQSEQGASWVNLGPTAASFQWNGGNYDGLDSGRPTAIAVHPSDLRQVYLAASGGGLWKSWDFGAFTPRWVPIGDSLPNMAVGALALDPQAPDTLYVGLGDFFDVPGGQVVKSTDGGGTWSAPQELSGTVGSLALVAQRVRSLRVDPADPRIVLVGTDVGLFRSTDAGASYLLVDLPNAGSAQVAESIWSIVYTGQEGGVSRWAASGVYACDASTRPPRPGYGVVTSETCSAGNPGDIWTSTDAGATWASRRAVPGALPAGSVGRINLGAGTPSAAIPPATVIYAQLGNQDEGQNGGAGYWRSNDSGQTFMDVTGILANPTSGTGGCTSVNVNGDQDWYNATIAVDPDNDSNVIAGGQLCGVRTTSGRASVPTWENVAHWLPPAEGRTSAGVLPYVHADWHASLVVRTDAGPRVLVASDGGLFWSDNAFDAAPPDILWNHANVGLVTHLAYSVASGDPANGDPTVVYTGLQDNGTRIRDALFPTVFNQVIGGDGIGAAASRDPASGISVYWASVNGTQQRCIPGEENGFCRRGGSWTQRPPTIPGCTNEGPFFFTRYAHVLASPTPHTFLTATNRTVHRAQGNSPWVRISTCMTAGSEARYVRNVAASATQDGILGAALSGGMFAVTSDCHGNNTDCTWQVSNSIGVDLNANGTLEGNEGLRYTSSLSFPPGPTRKPPGDVYVAASSATVAADGVSLVAPAIGHLFMTEDRGATFQPLHGNGTGFDLPNVGINVVRYDPADPSNNTLFVGTELGVYRTIDGGNTWHRYGVGLPLVSVTDIFISQGSTMMRVATYGRGVWEIYPSATAERGVSGTGDWDRDGRLDFIDLAAMGARLGTDPSAGAAPYYDWNLDMVGTTNAIDDADLVQLLSNLGGRP